MCDDFQLILLEHLLILNNILFICVGADFQKFIQYYLQIIIMSSHSYIVLIFNDFFKKNIKNYSQIFTI